MTPDPTFSTRHQRSPTGDVTAAADASLTVVNAANLANQTITFRPAGHRKKSAARRAMNNLARHRIIFASVALIWHQLSMDLEDWVLSPGRKVRSARGELYFIRAGENVKIGFSRDVTKRLAQLQTFFPFKLDIVLTMVGSAVSERAMHARFKASRVTGEWFRYAGDIAAYVEKNNVRTACQNRS